VRSNCFLSRKEVFLWEKAGLKQKLSVYKKPVWSDVIVILVSFQKRLWFIPFSWINSTVLDVWLSPVSFFRCFSDSKHFSTTTAVIRGGCSSGERAIAHQSEGQWFDSGFPGLHVLGQDTEPHVAYRCINRCMCVYEYLEKHVWVCVNGWMWHVVLAVVS